MTETVAQLHQVLVDVLAQRGNHSPDQPLTVAEIYQDLIPYREIRPALGFSLNEEYEHVLLAFLAGSGGFARVEPAEVQEELRLELLSPNPNVGVFRNYAACDVFVRLPDDFQQSRTPGDAEPDSSAPATPSAPPASSQRDNGQTEAKLAPPPTIPAWQQLLPRPAVTQETSPIQQKTTAPGCLACRQPLPADREARFCPFCGHDQSRRLCARCRKPVESGWKFCVDCGAPLAS